MSHEKQKETVLLEELTESDEWVEVSGSGSAPPTSSSTTAAVKKFTASSSSAESSYVLAEELKSLSIKELRQRLEQQGLDSSDCVEKRDLIDRLIKERAHETRSTRRTTASNPTAPAKPSPAPSKGVFRWMKDSGRKLSQKAGQTVQNAAGKARDSMVSILGLELGSIDIQLPRRDYQPGQKINGKCTLNLEQPVEAEQLTVALVAKRRYYSSKKKSTDDLGSILFNDEETVFHFPVKLAGQRTYVPKEQHTFEIPVPSEPSNKELWTGVAADVLRGFLTAEWPDEESEIQWTVEATLEVCSSVWPLQEKVRILLEKQR